ncbi:Lsr2 protein [Friedmanniella luteola]|uniref:Lsr2 protein n=1 Tax=Friedmanniella luteola TaxID=546871 RepID=A0A1H1LR99_9ACTN|nr:Lsr2 family protein [Friedmanniella luteola]SDR76927.1 Lsr2 protein [Friedmanniella luteola]
MAQRVQIILEDDYDGGEADETVSFALDGAEYEIDLSSENAQKLRDEFAAWIGHARKTGGRRRRVTNGASAKAADSDGAGSTSEIRAWAQANGHDVSSRGRVSSEVREAYERAHS